MGIGDSKLKETGDIRVTIEITYLSKKSGKSVTICSYSSRGFQKADVYPLGEFAKELANGDVTRIISMVGVMRDEPYVKKDVPPTTHEERVKILKSLIVGLSFPNIVVIDQFRTDIQTRTDAGRNLIPEIKEMFAELNLCYGMCYIRNKEACHCHGHKRAYCNVAPARLITEPKVVEVTTPIMHEKEVVPVRHSLVGLQFLTEGVDMGDGEVVVFEGYDTVMQSLQTDEQKMLVIAPRRLDENKIIPIALNQHMHAIDDYDLFMTKYRDELDKEIAKMSDHTAIIVVALPFSGPKDSTYFTLYVLDRCVAHKVKLHTIVIANVNQAPTTIGYEEIEKELEAVMTKTGSDKQATIVYTIDQTPDVEQEDK